jgi:hypothetical protein
MFILYTYEFKRIYKFGVNYLLTMYDTSQLHRPTGYRLITQSKINRVIARINYAEGHMAFNVFDVSCSLA